MSLDRRALTRPFQKVRKRLKKWHKMPQPEQVHALRTNSRRIESIMEALQLQSRKDRKLLAPLTEIRRRAGKVRDMDVLTLLVAGLKAKGESECLLRLIQDLSVSRYKQARKVAKLVRKYRGTLLRRLKKTSSHLDEIGNGGGESVDVQKPASEVAALTLELSRQLSDPPRLNRSNLHPYRLKLKNLRYVLEMAAPGDQDSQFMDALKNAQNAIGEWHDWESLKQISARVLDHNGCELLRQIESGGAAAYEQALAAANAVRDRYASKTSSGRRSPAGAAQRKTPHAITTVSRIA